MTVHRIVHDRAAVQSYTLQSPESDLIGAQLESGRPYEAELLSSLATLLNDGDIVVDAGAHVGNHTIYLALARRVLVHAYEPNPVTFKLLQQNVDANGLSSQVICHQTALGEHPGKGTLEAGFENNSGTSSVRVSEDGSIEIDTFPSVLGGPLRLLKIDVEGSEYAVLRGAANVLRRERPVLALELQRESVTFEATRELLAGLGYRRVGPNMAGTPTYLFAARVRDVLSILLLPQVHRRVLVAARSRLSGYVRSLTFRS